MEGIIGKGGSKRAVLQALEKLQEENTPVRLEIENFGVRFKSTISLHRHEATIARPLGFKMSLPEGTGVRFKIPEKDGKEIRLEITDDNFRHSDGKAFFICAIPTEFAEPSVRRSERFHTDRFKNLELFLPEYQYGYRIADLSVDGCRIDIGKESPDMAWALGKPVKPVHVRVGKTFDIELTAATPRMIKENAVGFEFDFTDDSKAIGLLEKLVHWLESWEEKQTGFPIE